MEVLGGLAFLIVALLGWRLLKVAFQAGWWVTKWSFKLFWGALFLIMLLTMIGGRGC